MFRIIFIIICTLFINFIISATSFSATQEEKHRAMLDISGMVKCMVCQGESIKYSSSEFSLSLKKVIEEQINLGKEQGEILEYLKSKYGEDISLFPKLQSSTVLLWFLPVMLIIFGIFLIIRQCLAYKYS